MACFEANEEIWNTEMRENFLFSSLTNHLNSSEFSVAFTIDLSIGFPPPFVVSTTIPRFFFADGHWVAVFYTKVRVTIQGTGRGCHPNQIVERSSRLLRLQVSSQVGVVRVIWYQSFGSSLSSLTNHLNFSEFFVAFTIDLSNGFPPPFVASTTIPSFLFAGGHWVAVFYTKNFLFNSLTNHLNFSEFFVAFTIDLSNGFPPPFVESTTIPRFLFAGGHWVAVFYTKVRVTIQATGRGCHPNLIVERSWRLLRLQVSSQVGVVRIIWYQSFGSSLSSLTNHLNLPEFFVAFTIDLSNGFPPPFVASTTIPRFLFAGGHWVAVFYTKARVTIQATGRGCHPNLIVERSWRLLKLRVSSQVGVVRIIWYQSFGSSLSSLTNHLNLSKFSVVFTIDLSNDFHHRLWRLRQYQGSCLRVDIGSRSSIPRLVSRFKQQVAVAIQT
ncbi:hypothetical protein TIFTF001_038581 [Ficus carica]|uniref:Uncharacterized protein n=1 Tax=Ficus carica TaxID=3494 RepID=A0AA88E877_FICCA|nr:hypothetical protein TIFTF001_038581 [Ficus carica]